MMWRARATMVCMLEARGYSELTMRVFKDYADFVRTANGACDALRITAHSHGHCLLVHFERRVKMGVKALRLLVQSAKKANRTGLIIVHAHAFTTPARLELRNKEFKIQEFDVDELQYDIMQHELNPVFTPLTNEEKNKVLDTHGWSLSDLPRMLATDPVARYLGLGAGNLIRISGKTPHGGYGLSYRVVVK